MTDLSNFDLFTLPVPRRGTDTSREAATDLTSRAPVIRQKVLEAISQAGPYGCTSEDLAAALDLPRVTVQPRTSELRALRKIADSGLRRLNPSSGKRAIVWTLPEFVRELGE